MVILAAPNREGQRQQQIQSQKQSSVEVKEESGTAVPVPVPTPVDVEQFEDYISSFQGGDEYGDMMLDDMIDTDEGHTDTLYHESSDKVIGVRQSNKIVDDFDDLCPQNDLAQILQDGDPIERVLPEGSPNIQSSNTTESHFKVAPNTNSKTDVDNGNLRSERHHDNHIEQEKLLDDLLLLESDNHKIDDYIQNGDLHLQDLHPVPQMEDLEGLLDLPGCDMLSPRSCQQQQQFQVQYMYQQPGYTQQSMSLQQQQFQQQMQFQQSQLGQVSRSELVPVADSEPATKKLKSNNIQDNINNNNVPCTEPPAYGSLTEVRGALATTLNALDGNFRNSVRQARQMDDNFIRRSTSHPLQLCHNMGPQRPSVVHNGGMQGMQGMQHKAQSFANFDGQQVLTGNRGFVPTPSFPPMQHMHPMQQPNVGQNPQLFNKLDYINGVPYVHDMDAQVFVDPATGRRLNPGPAYYKRLREEHGPNLQSIFSRLGSTHNLSNPLPEASLRQQHLRHGYYPPFPNTTNNTLEYPPFMTRFSSADIFDPNRPINTFLNKSRAGLPMDHLVKEGGIRGRGFVKEGVLDQIRSAGGQWLKNESLTNMHHLRQQHQLALHTQTQQQQKQQQQQMHTAQQQQQEALLHAQQQQQAQKTEVIQQETFDVKEVSQRPVGAMSSFGIAQRVVTEATEKGLDGRHSSGFTLESQFQRQMSGKIQQQQKQQLQGVSRDRQRTSTVKETFLYMVISVLIQLPNCLLLQKCCYFFFRECRLLNNYHPTYFRRFLQVRKTCYQYLFVIIIINLSIFVIVQKLYKL
eukprot:TRINITY_DN8718_c0_g2_i2.p1 TRINITY_DN8718_c0_g2~~TRINITY_DN8718_c0_g2_i2.p1  ORF type:complete len:800 (+),score=78.74 TRINITY_DN8718_c0_g2_i2:582-2981(+)